MSYDFPKRAKPASSNNRWLISFADLISLILTFFVMLYSMTDPVQIIPKPTKKFNSSIEFEESGKNSQVKLQTQPGNVDNEYMESIIRDKIANDDDMKKLQVKIIDDKLTIYSSIDVLTDATIKAIYDTLSPLAASTGVVASNLTKARAVAYKFNKVGMEEELSYFEDNNLQNNVKILVYPKFQ